MPTREMHRACPHWQAPFCGGLKSDELAAHGEFGSAAGPPLPPSRGDAMAMAQPMMAPPMMPAEPELPTLPTLPRGGLLTMAKEPKPSRWLQGVLPQLAHQPLDADPC